MLKKTALLAALALSPTFASAFDFVSAANAYKITSDAERGGARGDEAKIERWGNQIDKGSNVFMFERQRTELVTKVFLERLADSGLTISNKRQVTKPFTYTIKGAEAVEVWQFSSFTENKTNRPLVAAYRYIALCADKQLGEIASLYFDPSKDPMVLDKHYFIPLAWSADKLPWVKQLFGTACGTTATETASAPVAASTAQDVKQ